MDTPVGPYSRGIPRVPCSLQGERLGALGGAVFSQGRTQTPTPSQSHKVDWSGILLGWLLVGLDGAQKRLGRHGVSFCIWKMGLYLKGLCEWEMR